MTFIIKSPEDVINLSLVRIGYKYRIGSIYEGSIAAKKALDIYSQTRDEVLRNSDWGFAERNIPMRLLKQAPPYGYIPPIVWDETYPPPPWFFEYEYPDDCLKIRSVRYSPIFVTNMDPQPREFSIVNSFPDGIVSSNHRKSILCNIPNAILTYTGQITDPTTWESDFIEALASSLGRRLAPSLMGLDHVKMEITDEATSKSQADSERG